MLVEPAAVVEVHQRCAGGLVHQVAVVVVTTEVEGLDGRAPGIVPVAIQRRAVGDKNLPCASLLGQLNDGAGHAGIGGVPLVRVSPPDQVRLDHHGIARLDERIQPAGRCHRLAHQRLYFRVRDGPGRRPQDGDLGRTTGRAGVGRLVLQRAHAAQQRQQPHQYDQFPASFHSSLQPVYS